VTFTSFAQNFEDVVLWRALSEVQKGRYVDIGAHDPVIDSVSHAFYQAGWRGLHVEPVPTLAAKLREARPDEPVIEAAVSDQPGPIPFFELSGLSTGRPDVAEHHTKVGHKPRKILVPTVRLDELLKIIGEDIHWLKIDVEGMEADVLKSWGDSPIRPWVLVIESTFPDTQRPTQHLWIDDVLRRGYDEVLFDGLSRYFVHETHKDIADRLRRPANVFDRFQITAQHFSASLVREETATREAAAEARQTQLGTELLQVRERLRGVEIELEAAQTARTRLEQESSAEIADSHERLQRVEADLAAEQAKLQRAEADFAAEQAKLQRAEADFAAEQASLQSVQAELAAERAMLRKAEVQRQASTDKVEELGNELSSAQETGRALNAEMLGIARLVGIDADDNVGSVITGAVAAGSTYAAVKSRLDFVRDELQAGREHAISQYAAGLRSRDPEVKFLTDRIAGLQSEIAEARSRLDQQAAAIASLKGEAESRAQRLAEATTRLSAIYGSRGGRLARLLRLLPNERIAAGGSDPPPQTYPINHREAGEQPAARLQVMEIAVNDVRHVSSLLALNGSTFVDALYRTFLKRSPDRSGRDHYIGRLQAGHGKEAVLVAVAMSREAQALGVRIEGLTELCRAQARRSNWFFRFFRGGDRVLDARLNKLEFTLGEAHNSLLDRLERIQDAVDRTQSALVHGARAGNGLAAPYADSGVNGVPKSIKRGISVAPSNSAPEFIDALKREVQSSSEAQSLRRV